MICEAEVGMLVVETVAKIRRAFFVQGKSIKAICRELGVSRKVVRKVIRSGWRGLGQRTIAAKGFFGGGRRVRRAIQCGRS
jgi:hypothetical protein